MTAKLGTIKERLNHLSFTGQWWTILINPAFITRRRLYQAIKGSVQSLMLEGKGVWLDVGCGSRPYEALFNVENYIGMDIQESGHPSENKRYDILYDGTTFPLEDHSMDGVLCTQVLEHSPNPGRLLSEIARVLKPGGKLILTAPFLWQEHEQPYDYFRFTSFGLSHLLEQSGLQVEKAHKSTGSIEAMAQTLSAYISTNFVLPLPGWGRFMALILCAPIQGLGVLFQKILPDRKDLFLDMVILAHKEGKRDGEK